MIFKHLHELLKRKHISQKSVCEMLDITEKTFWSKMHGKTEFTWKEVETICREIVPEYKIEYIFERCKEDEQTKN